MTDLDKTPQQEDDFNHNAHIVNLHQEDALKSYIKRVHSYPMLTQNEEYTAAKNWQDHKDPKAKDTLIKSHLKLLNKIAHGYRGYGLPVEDLISEGHLGMMKALNGFDPEKGVRFSTYATLWIKAAIKDYVLKSFSLVKTGTTNAQKKLFFNLRSMKQKALEEGQTNLTQAQMEDIAQKLQVPLREVKEMDKRLSGSDYSLNTKFSDDHGGEWQDWLTSDEECHSEKLAHKDELEKRTAMVKIAVAKLKDREKQVFVSRRLEEPPKTLDELAQDMNLSKERIRQIEMSAFSKVQKNVHLQATHTPFKTH